MDKWSPVKVSVLLLKGVFKLRVLVNKFSILDLKRQLQSLKRELKGWEAMFERKHGHKPTKVHVRCVLTPKCGIVSTSHTHTHTHTHTHPQTDIEESADEIRGVAYMYLH